MRPLELDFASAPTSGVKGWGLLALGLVAVMASGLMHQAISGQQAELAHRQTLVAAQRGATTNQRADISRSPEESRSHRAVLAEIRSISTQVNRPWERLFISMESLPLEDVALLSLVTAGHDRQLRIQAEARDLAAMLAFHQDLEKNQELSDAYLINHEVVDQVSRSPVRFNLLVTWSGSHAPL